MSDKNKDITVWVVSSFFAFIGYNCGKLDLSFLIIVQPFEYMVGVNWEICTAGCPVIVYTVNVLDIPEMLR